MSQENAEIVRQVFDAVARRDTDAVPALYDPDVELDTSQTELAALFGHSVYRGYEGLRSFNREWHEAFEDVEAECEELIEAGEHVVAVTRYRVRGRASGIEVSGLARGGIWAIRAGKVTRVRFFNTRDDALEAVGLSE
jgi:ketosteroid isomerase-like protein